MEGVNGFLEANQTHLQFTPYEGTNRMMVEVIDDQTGDVIRTIPAKDLLDLSARIGEMLGMFLDKKG